MALKHFIQKNSIKNEEIKSLREITAQLKKNLEEQKEIVLKIKQKQITFPIETDIYLNIIPLIKMF